MVYVLDINGQPLMPTTRHGKVRRLLNSHLAKVVKRCPFTIQLLYQSTKEIQPVSLGVDAGSKHIGVVATTEKKVVYQEELSARNDVVKLLSARRTLRRTRRNRKTRYRKPRFNNRVHSKHKGWLAPSVEVKIQEHITTIKRICQILPISEIQVETAEFDLQRLKAMEEGRTPPVGTDYQLGEQYDFYNTRQYVLHRDGYTCQCCGKSKGKILQTHHIIYRSNGGTDRADNLITVCTDCHTSKNHQKGGMLYKWQEQHKKVMQYKEPPFMNTLRRRIFAKYPDAAITYGSETTPKRKEKGLDKTHYNDAIIISGVQTISENPDEWLLIRQFRKKKRSLHEGTPRKGRKEPNRTQKRNSKNTPYYRGYYLNDKVRVLGKTGYISGFTGGAAYVKDSDNQYITLPNKSYKQVGISNLQHVCHNNNWQYITKTTA